MLSGIIYRYSLWFVLFFSLAFTGSVQAKPEHGKKFKDWMVVCEKLPASQKEVCNIFQNVTNDKGKVVMQIAVGYPPESEQPQALVTLPLGVMLQPGIEFKAGNAEADRFPFSVCVKNGCVAIVKLDADTIKGMKTGKDGTVKFAAAKNKIIEVPISLNGFTAAFKSLK